MPSFREGDDEYCEKTLSVIYDDTDLARDHEQTALAIQSKYETAEQDDCWANGMFSPACRPTPSDSIEITAEAPKHIISHIITAESAQYETRERTRLMPPRPGALQASN
mmetsp:Transcript_13759/g.18784  ORF Transcript_13759/g.18784 Transcript_13759/m.18784 type:complete len:109 (+) Transcript_13759:1648-1974(+)